jgi:hypothetical protein
MAAVSSTLFMDDFRVGDTPPMSIDRDGDGVSDVWEVWYFGAMTNSWDDDPDGDNRSNRDEFLAATNPMDSNSYFQIMSVDLENDTSTNIDLVILGGDYPGPTNYFNAGDFNGRTYHIYAGNGTSTNTKALIANLNDLSESNAWTHVGATAASRSFYEVTTTYGGVVFTNVEKWAVYVEPREAGKAYLMCIPVVCEGVTNNNLNARLGEQLALGLYASDTLGEGDRIRYIDDSGAWVECYLTESQGWTTIAGDSLDVAMLPGQPLWVLRGSNDATRSDSVLIGQTVQPSDVPERTFNTNGWTVFGWPLSEPRRALSTDASADQLGFSSMGAGGISGSTNDVNHGDQLWVSNGDGAWEWYWLVDDGTAAAYNDRWWRGEGGGFADITLDPGKAYYYYHSPKSGATNFSWRPSLP